MARQSRFLGWVVLAVLGTAGVAPAAESGPIVTVPSRVESLALFKNGLGYFVTTVEAPAGQRVFRVRPPGAGTHGTYWVSYPQDLPVESVVALEVEAAKDSPATSVYHLLKANVGVKVRVHLGQELVQGMIEGVLEESARPEPRPYDPGRSVALELDGYARGGRAVLIRTEMELVVVEAGQIQRVDFVEGQPKRTWAQPEKRMLLEVRLGPSLGSAPAGGGRLTVSYLAKGVTWTPSYQVDISQADKARISASALVVNEVTDLEEASVSLVTGYPHLQFADIVSPLALKENLAGFLEALVRGESTRGDQARAARVATQRVAYNMASMGGGGGAMGAMPVYGAEQAGKTAEDLFLYPLAGVQLKRDQVGYYPLFTAEVPYEHVYKWDIPDYVNERDRYAYQAAEPQEEQPEVVWHVVRLINTTQTPWTTAPAMTAKDGAILGQDTLLYTPPGAKKDLKLTQAVNVRADQAERETQRQRDALVMYDGHFDLVTVEGTLSATNLQDREIALEIAKTLSGQVKSTDPEAKEEKLAKGLLRMNGLQKLTWQLCLQPNETRQLKYVYDVYVRR